MASIITATTTSGLTQSADNSGVLQLASGTGNLVTVPSGTGTAVVNGVNSSIVSGTAVASTSGTSIDFTSIPSWVKRITINFAGVSTNGSSNYLIQLGDSGGVETTGYLGSGSGGASSIGSTNYTAGFGLRLADSTSPVSGSIVITLLNSASNLWVANGLFGIDNAGYFLFTAGQKATSATLDRVRITTVNGTDTFDAGTINILYE